MKTACITKLPPVALFISIGVSMFFHIYRKDSIMLCAPCLAAVLMWTIWKKYQMAPTTPTSYSFILIGIALSIKLPLIACITINKPLAITSLIIYGVTNWILPLNPTYDAFIPFVVVYGEWARLYYLHEWHKATKE